ncbi:MAG: peptidoglycan-binding protein [Clostridia bacterium]|nr:peptidoglycan-binding protein [Clostridia bacterium]MBQ3939067.1 peptidoglycan-binding protein [Clostridia bacterium]MBQ5488544.1 peptidoglycan-binding protein [Clostridia bacterium]
MKNAMDFIRFALSHAKPETIPLGAKLPLSFEECGTRPWEYLPGTAGDAVTQELLDERFANFYKLLGWSRERFDRMTENFVIKRVTASDSQGLLNAYLGLDATPHFCYSAWCTDKGEIGKVKRPFALGEAVFFRDEDGRAVHTGFVCGSLGGETLVVEARGLGSGVCVTKLTERPWTHRGLVTKQLIYDENCYDEQIVLSLRTPMLRGESIRQLQLALNSLGYFCGAADGVLGENTMTGVRDFVDAHFRSRKTQSKKPVPFSERA